jgi:hypothetical protein
MAFGALMFVERSATEAFDILSRPSLQSCYLPEVARSVSVSRSPDDEVIDFEVHKFGTSRYRVHHHFYRDRLHIEWSLDPHFKNDLRALRGYYTIVPVGTTRALIEYGTAVDVSFWVPTFLQEEVMGPDVTQAMDRVRIFVDRGGRCKP